jgi:uncharacterized protein (DUF302 family)
MPNTKLVIFGNPKGGTEFMLADPNFSIDLPLKIVIMERNDTTEIVYKKMGELATQYQVADLYNSIKKMDECLKAIVNQVIAK